MDFGRKIITIILVVVIFLSPYLFNIYDFLIGWDASNYVLELLNYLNSSNLKSVENFFQETGLFLLIKELSLITNFADPRGLFKVSIFIITISQTVVSFCILKRIKSSARAIILVSMFTFLAVNIHLTYLFIFRQYLATFLLLVFILFFFITKKFSRIQIVSLGLIAGSIFFIHRGVFFISVIILLFFLVPGGYSIKKIKQYFYSLFIIVIIAILINLPYLYLYHEWVQKLFFDFFIKSANNITGAYSFGQGVSLISGLNGPYKESFLTKITYNSGILLIFILFIKNISKLSAHTLVLLIVLVILMSSGGHFSQRIPWIVLFLMTISIAKLITKNKLIYILLFSVIILGGTSLIFTKTPHVKKALQAEQFLTLVPKDAIIISVPWNELIAGQLGYTTWNYLNTFNDNVHKYGDRPEYYEDFWKKLLSFGHSQKIKIPNEIMGKPIYIVIGGYLVRNNELDSKYRIDIEKWDSSAYATKVISNPNNDYFANVYLYKY